MGTEKKDATVVVETVKGLIGAMHERWIERVRAFSDRAGDPDYTIDYIIRHHGTDSMVAQAAIANANIPYLMQAVEEAEKYGGTNGIILLRKVVVNMMVDTRGRLITQRPWESTGGSETATGMCEVVEQLSYILSAIDGLTK